MEMNNSVHRKKNRRRKSLRRAVNLLLAFVTGIAVFCFVFALELHYGWQSSRLLYQTVIGDGYAYRNVQQFRVNLEEMLEELSLSEDILDSIFDEDALYRQYSKDIETVLLKGEEVERSGAEFGESFAAAICEYLSSQGMTVSSEQEEQISQAGIRAAQSYENTMSVSYMQRFRALADSMTSALMWVVIVSLIVTAAGIGVLLRLHHYEFHAVQYISAAVLFAAICNVGSIIVLGRTAWIRDVGIGPESYRGMLEAFYIKGMEFCGLVTLVELAALMALQILGQRLRKKI